MVVIGLKLPIFRQKSNRKNTHNLSPYIQSWNLFITFRYSLNSFKPGPMLQMMDTMHGIAKYLARFSEEVQLLNSNNDYSVNMYAENMLIGIFEKVYGIKLKNVNVSDHKNYSAIDLVEDSREPGISFQVTSTASIQKVKDCLRKFFGNGVYKKTKTLYIYILTSKQKNYSQDAVDKVIREEIQMLIDKKEIGQASDIGFIFTVDSNILDKQDLYKKLNADNDLQTARDLLHYLEKQFGLIDEKEDLSAWYSRLKSLFYDVVMNDEQGMTLDHIYTEPSFSILGSALSPNVHTNKEKQKFYPAHPKYKISEFIADVFKGENTLGLQEMRNFILILGYPGQGKSSLCKKIARDYIAGGKHKDKALYYFQLRNIRQVKEFVFNPFTVLYHEACEMVERELDKFEFNKSFIILDGLDEFYMRENLPMEDIDRVCVELVRHLEKHPELYLILTSRYGYVDDEKLTREKIIIAQLGSFSLELQKEWLVKYRQFHNDIWLTEKELVKFHRKEKYKHIRELVEQPLLLHMIAAISNEIKESANRSSIYQNLFRELIDRNYTEEGPREVFKDISKEDLWELIREVAFSIFISDHEYITKTDLLKLSAVQKFLRLMPEQSFRDSIKGVMISFYFKETKKSENDPAEEDKSNYAIEFLHKSLQEYMTAEKIYYTISEQFLDRRKGKGKYIVDDARSALEIINKVFGKRALSKEVKDMLYEIIGNATDLDKDELVDRLLLFLSDFLKNDFIIEYKMDQDKEPVSTALLSFHGLWTFASLLGVKKNYIPDDRKKRRFINYLGLLGNLGAFNRQGMAFGINCQNLSYLDVKNCTFNNVDFSNVDFSECWFHRVRFESCIFNDTNFKSAVLTEVEIVNSTLLRCNFSRCSIESLSITNGTLKDSDLSFAVIQDLFMNFDKDPISKRGYGLERLDFSKAVISRRSLSLLQDIYPEINEQGVSALQIKDKTASAGQPPLPGQETADEKENNDPNYKKLL